MSTGKYTEGPWELVSFGGGAAGVQIDWNLICGAYKGGDEDILRVEDARLMVAAPDLLEALEERQAAVETLLEAIEAMDVAPIWPFSLAIMAIKDNQKAKEAIAKATGETL